MQSVIQVTPGHATIQAPQVTIQSGDRVVIQAQNTLALRAGQQASLQGSSALVEAAGPLDLRGATVRFNGGGKPLATVGSLVQLSGPSLSEHITTGTIDILGP